MSLLRFLPIALIFLLYGCTSVPDAPISRVDMPEQLKKLNQLSTWSLSGKMAVRDSDQALSASLRWTQQNQQFEFRLTNMLGMTIAHMSVNKQNATLITDDKTFTNNNPDALIFDTTGLDVPVTSLSSWVKGLPRETDRYSLNANGLVDTLTPGCTGCASWQVTYRNYGRIAVGESSVWLPHSITLRQQAPSNKLIKIRIDSWKTS